MRQLFETACRVIGIWLIANSFTSVFWCAYLAIELMRGSSFAPGASALTQLGALGAMTLSQIVLGALLVVKPGLLTRFVKIDTPADVLDRVPGVQLLWVSLLSCGIWMVASQLLTVVGGIFELSGYSRVMDGMFDGDHVVPGVAQILMGLLLILRAGWLSRKLFELHDAPHLRGDMSYD